MPLIAAGNATPDPELDELKERARKLGQNVDWDKQPKPTRPRATVTASAPSYYPPEDTERFAAKLAKAVKTAADFRNGTRKQHPNKLRKNAIGIALCNADLAQRATDASHRKNGARLR
jgi:hypothetical protein